MSTNINTFVYDPVLREIKYFSHMFNRITWLGYGHNIPSASKIIKNIPQNIQLIALPPSGGDRILDKLNIILK